LDKFSLRVEETVCIIPALGIEQEHQSYLSNIYYTRIFSDLLSVSQAASTDQISWLPAGAPYIWGNTRRHQLPASPGLCTALDTLSDQPSVSS